MAETIIEQLEFICSDALIATLSPQTLPGVLGRVISQSPSDLSVRSSLEEIPSETTLAERCALYHWFRYFWDGSSDCLEIGPFLGGTSRAIALGMLHNTGRQQGKRLMTVDRFSHYYSGERLVNYLAPLFNSGKLPAAWRTSLKSQELVKFIDVYRHLHSSTEYGKLLSIEEGALPDQPAEARTLPDIYTPKLNTQLGALFIDGCKSWYSVKHLMMNLDQNLPVGSFVISQDYAWFTCFWMPAFFEIFSDHFELLANVDSSYFFRLTKQLRKEDIAHKFPDHPRDIGQEGIIKLFNTLTAQSADRGDTRMVVLSQLQLACALAVIGAIPSAYQVAAELKGKPHAKSYEKLINQTLSTLNRRFTIDPEQTHVSL